MAAVEPAALVARTLTGPRVADHPWVAAGGCLVVGAGKAAARMALGCEQALGASRLDGLVVTADGCGVVLEVLEVAEAGHPVPDERGVVATRRILERVATSERDGIICLISGGASSLLVGPRPPLTLAEKVATTRALLACGAAIDEVNAVRKHLSTVKGGALLRAAQSPVLTLILSDVIGDDPSTIGSGPTTPDPTTFADALAVLQRYGIEATVPPVVLAMLRQGLANPWLETVKPADTTAMRGTHLVVGSNATAVEAMAVAAVASGWAVHVETTPICGGTTEAARAFADRLRRHAETATEPLLVLAGGETTVRVRGTGRGGRNQEFALAMAPEIVGVPVGVLSAGTDGVDGPTDAAGAFVDGLTLARARACGLSAGACLENNDAYTFFSAVGDLLHCGPTGTNVMDVKVALVVPRGAADWFSGPRRLS